VDDPKHQPLREEPMTEKDLLLIRLYQQPVLYELARAVSYGGKRPGQLKDKCAELAEKYGQHAVTMAFTELTMLEKDTVLTVLRPEARKACWQLRGSPPEHPSGVWTIGRG
jgi:hypothetical protein